jgi:CHAT domain-containing protein/tetratricopeptide (TPR) repeat protein
MGGLGPRAVKIVTIMKTIFTIFILSFPFTPAYSQLWKAFADTAKTYRLHDSAARSIVYYKKALEELKKDSSGTKTYLKMCASVGLSLYSSARYEEAEPFFLEAKQIGEKLLGTKNADYAAYCNNLAAVYDVRGENEKAEPLYLEAKQINEKLSGKYHLDYINPSISLATLYGRMGRYEKAEPLLLELRSLIDSTPGKKSPYYASVINSLATIYMIKGQLTNAEPLLIEAREISEKNSGKGSALYAYGCINLANLYKNKGQYAKAESFDLEGKDILEKVSGKQTAEYATCCTSLADIYTDMGRYEAAEALHLEAMQIREKQFGGKLRREYAGSCNDLASLYEMTGEYNKAEQLYLEAMQIQVKLFGKQHPDYPLACYGLAVVYRDIGQFDKAEALFLEAMQIQENLTGKQDPNYATFSDGLGLLYSLTGQYDKADTLLLAAKQIREKVLGIEHIEYAHSCNNVGALYYNMGEYEKAEAPYLEALQIKEKLQGKEHPEYASACDNLGNLYFEMADYKKAEPLYIEAKRIRQKALGNKHLDYKFSCDHLANFYRVTHRPLQAQQEYKEAFSISAFNLSSVFQFTTEKEKAKFIQNILGEDDKAYSFYYAEKLGSDLPYSLSLFHRNLILSSSEALNKLVFSVDDTTISRKYTEWVNLKKYLAVLYSKPLNDRKENVPAMEEAADQMEKDLARLSSGFKKQTPTIDWKAIENKLQPGQASVEFVSFHNYNGKRFTDSIIYLAIILKKGLPLPEMVYLFTEKQLLNILSSPVKDLYTARGIITNNQIAASKSIYNLVWKPLEKELTGIRTIYFAPAGELHRIAFAALPINKKEVLSDRYNLIQLTSTASVPDLTPTFIRSSDNLQLYGGINYDTGTFNYLPGTQAEIDSIKMLATTRQMQAVTSSGVNATEESFKALDGKASPSVIHIATHGFFVPDPKTEPTNNIQSADNRNGMVFTQSDNPLFRSGLLFAGANLAWAGQPTSGIDDGILTAYEVSNMYLPNTKLVVLSACETALGDIRGSEGVYGLQRAFKIAGVPNLIMSLWKVPDAETVEFMQEFYKNLFAGKSISTAFYQAQNTLKAKYRTDPYKWAAWVLVR